MHKMLRAAACCVTLTWANQAAAYPSSFVPVESYQVLEDDLIIIEMESCDVGTFCFASLPSSFHDDEFYIKLESHGTGTYVVMYSTLPKLRAFGTGLMQFRSFDDVTLEDPIATGTYNLRAYFNRDFLWVEVSRPGALVVPVKSTLFFVGAPKAIYDQYSSFTPPYYIAGFANYEEFKSNVQQRYADLYRIDAPGMIEFRTEVKWGAMNIAEAAF